MAQTHATSHDPQRGAPAAARDAQTATGPQRGALPADTAQLAVRCIHTMRTLAMDAVQQPNSGHPGTPMALAPLVYTLWQRVLRFDPQDPLWPNRDRFVPRTVTLRCCSGPCSISPVPRQSMPRTNDSVTRRLPRVSTCALPRSGLPTGRTGPVRAQSCDAPPVGLFTPTSL
jgi:hypothetical protein